MTTIRDSELMRHLYSLWFVSHPVFLRCYLESLSRQWGTLAGARLPWSLAKGRGGTKEKKLTEWQSLAHLSLLTLEGVGGRPQIGFGVWVNGWRGCSGVWGDRAQCSFILSPLSDSFIFLYVFCQINQLEKDKDVISQSQAISVLEKLPQLSFAVINALNNFLNDTKVF